MTKIKIVFSILLLIGLTTQMFAQMMGAQQPRQMPVGQFNREIYASQFYNFADLDQPELSKVDFHFSIVNDILSFVKVTDSEYRANYEITVIFYNDKKEALAEKSARQAVLASSYEETNSRSISHQHQLSFSLPPGTHRYTVQLLDRESNDVQSYDRTMTLRPFGSDRLRLSDIVLVDVIDCQNFTYSPNLSGVFSHLKSAVAAYVEIYPSQPSDSIQFSFKILDAQMREIYRERMKLPGEKRMLPVCLSFKSKIDKPGEYVLEVSGEAATQSVKMQKRFTVHWSNLGIRESNLELAIKQLEIIAKKKDLDIINRAPDEQKQKLFDEFWKQRDPSPDTETNELKDEFFRRIDFANRNFIEPFRGREGWETDRGKVYVKNGPPSEVEKFPSEPFKPTAEIWYYAKLNMRFIFSDRSGNGEFRLVRTE